MPTLTRLPFSTHSDYYRMNAFDVGSRWLMRKTKIVATIGPASKDPAILEQMLIAGMDVARLNFSHGTFDEHTEAIKNIRELAARHNKHVAILQDLGGTKMRLGAVDGTFRLNVGDVITLSSDASSQRKDVLPFPQPRIIQTLRPGNKVFISDGTICLEVTESLNTSVKTIVKNGGLISSFKGVNLPGVAIERPIISEADMLAIKHGVKNQVDWLAVSFVRSAKDLRDVREYMESVGGAIPIMAKLERTEAIDNLNSIMNEAQAVMVARGDLGIEIPMYKVPVVQKKIVELANKSARLSVIATQMLRSMIISPTPTRAEISDITTAVLDGCDAILLSDETAIGQFPVEAIKVAAETIAEAETIYPYYKDMTAADRTQAIAEAATDLCEALRAIPIVLTSTGRAAFEVSRYRPQNDVLVFSHDEAILRRVCIGWGLIPVAAIAPEQDIPKLVRTLIKKSLESGLVKEMDTVTIVHGFLTGVTGTSNTIQVLDLRQYLNSEHGLSQGA